jgi:hypothetical protein
MRPIASVFAGLLLASTLALQAHASTAFTYQGELSSNSVLANGDYDFRFILYSADVGGAQIGPIVTQAAVPVTQGIFSVQLDFGVVFGSADSWLDIAIKPAGGPTYTPLSPRQAVTPAPRAMALSLPYVDIVSVPAAMAIDVTNYSGGVARFRGGNSGFEVVHIDTTGAGAGLWSTVDAAGESSAIVALNYGSERDAGEFEIYNPASDSPALFVRTNGSGLAVQAEVNANTMASALFARTTSNVTGSFAAIFGGPVTMQCQGAQCTQTYALRTYGNLSVVGTLSKSAGSFRIDHPLDPTGKYLSHSFVESPDMKNIYDGVVTLDASGSAQVELPDWFEALNEAFRYQLTAIGRASPGLYVSEEVRDRHFAIAGGTPNSRVSWQVTGIRHDAYAKAHPIPVEEEKVGDERGRYLTPDAYGLAPEQAIGFAQPLPLQVERPQPAPDPLQRQ